MLAALLTVSYRRLAPGYWSAPLQVWGVENREAALRLVPAAADGAPAHLELKVADLAANPYLLLGAAILPGCPPGRCRASPCDSQAAELRRAAGCSEAELVAAAAWWQVVGGIG